MSTLHELYGETITDHNKSPRNFRKMDDATNHVDGYNPLCGDHYMVYVKIENDIIIDVSFEGSGCAISKASASIMSLVLKGKTKFEAEKIFEQFHKLVKGELNSDNIEELDKLGAFVGVSEFPARIKCATLAWHTLHSALTEKKQHIILE